jgi:hypothetical protein
VGPTADAEAHVGGEVVVIVTAVTAVTAVLLAGLVLVELVALVDAEARAPERLTEAGWASLDAATRMVDAPERCPAIPTGKIDDPTARLPLISPSDGFEEAAIHTNGIGHAADLLPHLPFALLAYGHNESSFNPATSQTSIACGCDTSAARRTLGARSPHPSVRSNWCHTPFILFMPDDVRPSQPSPLRATPAAHHPRMSTAQ